jgi:hypothetical protein
LLEHHEYQYLIDKFTNGLTFTDREYVVLDRINIFGATCINASNIFSAKDIVIGSFRYCINNPKNIDAAKEMMSDLANIPWYKKIGLNIFVREFGVVLRPKEKK